MLRALIERGIVPDLVLGTSIGAINGVAVAADPSAAGIERLTDAWSDIDRSGVFDGSVVRQLARLARTRTHLHSNASLCAMLDALLPVDRIEDLAVAIPVRRRQHRARRRALVRRRPDRPGGRGVGVRARAAGAGRDRRRALHRRRRRQQHPAEPGDRAGRRRRSTSCTSGAWTVRWKRRARRGRSRSWPSRSPAAIASSATSRRSRAASRCTCWRPASRTRRASPTARSFATATRRMSRERIDRAHEASARYLDEHDARTPGAMTAVPFLARRLVVAPLVLLFEAAVVVASPRAGPARRARVAAGRGLARGARGGDRRRLLDPPPRLHGRLRRAVGGQRLRASRPIAAHGARALRPRALVRGGRPSHDDPADAGRRAHDGLRRRPSGRCRRGAGR